MDHVAVIRAEILKARKGLEDAMRWLHAVEREQAAGRSAHCEALLAACQLLRVAHGASNADRRAMWLRADERAAHELPPDPVADSSSHR